MLPVLDGSRRLRDDLADLLLDHLGVLSVSRLGNRLRLRASVVHLELRIGLRNLDEGFLMLSLLLLELLCHLLECSLLYEHVILLFFDDAVQLLDFLLVLIGHQVHGLLVLFRLGPNNRHLDRLLDLLHDLLRRLLDDDLDLFSRLRHITVLFDGLADLNDFLLGLFSLSSALLLVVVASVVVVILILALVAVSILLLLHLLLLMVMLVLELVLMISFFHDSPAALAPRRANTNNPGASAGLAHHLDNSSSRLGSAATHDNFFFLTFGVVSPSRPCPLLLVSDRNFFNYLLSSFSARLVSNFFALLSSLVVLDNGLLLDVLLADDLAFRSSLLNDGAPSATDVASFLELFLVSVRL